MKKVFTILACALLVLSFGLVMSGCAVECEHTDADGSGSCDNCGEIMSAPPADDCTEHTDADGNNKCDSCGAEMTTSPAGDRAFIKDGVPTFQFVVNSQSTSSEIMYQINQLANDIGKVTSGTVSIVSDTADNVIANEILIGTVTTRGASYEFDGHDWGLTGWAIKIIDSKIVVVAGSDDAMKSALSTLKRDVFGIKASTNSITDLTITESMADEKAPPEYTVKNIYIGETDVRDMVISFDYDQKITREIATNIQTMLYRYTGVYLDIVRNNKVTGKAIEIKVVENFGEESTAEGYRTYVDDGNLIFACEFPDRFAAQVTNFFQKKIVSTNKSTVKIAADYEERVNLRDIYYSEFNAVGDGTTDDFMAIKAAHDYANLHGHTVHADGNKTYYFGKGSGSNTITIQTDTYWHGCTFIFDDYDILPSDGEFGAPIFSITPSKNSYTISGSNLPITSIYEGDTTFGNWVPGERVLVQISNSSRRHFIRYGANESNGSSQTEMLLINSDGTIDPSTPLQWNYEKVTSMTVYYADDREIIVSGGDVGQDDSGIIIDINGTKDNVKRALVKTIFNNAPSEYNYYHRNIQITRSNATLKNIEHVLIGDTEREHAAPYTGFTQVTKCTDVVVSGCIFQLQASFSTIGAAGTSVGMGSYEIAASYANNVLWRDCKQSNFFEKNGAVKYHGFMGTNYCKNLNFDNMFVCSFDAHCGTYNATIKNSTIEHLNFIGEGTIKLENVTMYTDGSNAAMIFRSDYGSTWQGRVIVDGLTMKTSKEDVDLSLIKAEWTNHYFGYTTYLPEIVEMNNVQIIHIGYKMTNGVRSEWEIEKNHVPLHMYYHLERYKTVDISDPDQIFTTAAYQNDYKNCNCHNVYDEASGKNFFNDTDGDGRCNNKRDPDTSYNVWCWGFDGNADKTVNANPFVPTEKVYVTNCGDLEVIVPPTPQFSDTELYIDGELQVKE